MAHSSSAASIAPLEIAKFSAQAKEWWAPNGAFRALHELGPLRLAYLKTQVGASLKGLKILDVGCGGGLMTEVLAREGAELVGVDASVEAIEIARAHAVQSGLDIAYRQTSAEALAQTGETFDVITALEIVEHVADLDSFMTALGKMLKPDGLLIVATLNRTKRSFLLAVVAAEYLLGWVPAGTHDWDRFVTPAELAALYEKNGIMAKDCTGVVYRPLGRKFEICKGKAAVNYFMTGKKEKPACKT